MNERIRQLREQAEEWVCKNYPDAMDDNDEFHAQTMEKFAELIVKECGVALSPMLRDQISRGRGYDLIKQHFGVES
jgi:hypothetical protein